MRFTLSKFEMENLYLNVSKGNTICMKGEIPLIQEPRNNFKPDVAVEIALAASCLDS